MKIRMNTMAMPQNKPKMTYYQKGMLSVMRGLTKVIMRVQIQFTEVAAEVPLSLQISLMYIQVMGPGPNSKATTNSRMNTSDKSGKSYLNMKPVAIRKIMQKVYVYRSNVLRPNLLRRGMAAAVAAKLKALIRAVAWFASRPWSEKMTDE